jgi:hypothetical protein
MTPENVIEARPVSTAANVETRKRVDIQYVAREEKSVAPIIDAEAEELAALKAERLRLFKEDQAIRDKFNDLRDQVTAPNIEKLRLLNKRIDALGPKPSCFGIRDDFDQPGCDTCSVGALCYRASRDRLVASGKWSA